MKRTFILMCLLGFALYGCGGGDGGSSETVSPPGTLGPQQVDLVLSPQGATRVAGGAVQYEAVAHYEDGTAGNITDRCTFSSSDPTVASFPGNKKGEALANATGTTTITARCPGNFEKTANLTITADIVDFIFSPPVHELRLGIPKKFCAYIIDSAGHQEEVCDETSYTIEDPDILRHNGGGNFEGLLSGETTVEGKFQAGPSGQIYTASARAVIDDVQPIDLIVEYPPVNIPVNHQERVRVFAVYPDVEEPLYVRAECRSDNPEVAQCSYQYGDLHVVGVGRGTANFEIEWQGLTDTFTLSVGPR